jgi:hypothetical protein
VPHRLAGGAEPAGVTEFGPQCSRGDLADPVLGLQGLAAGLAAGERGDLAAQRHQLGIQRVQDPQRGEDRLPAGGRQLLAGLEPAAVVRPQ